MAVPDRKEFLPMPARLRLLESLPAGCERPLPLLKDALGIHGRSKIGNETNLAHNRDGSLSVLLYGQCIVRLYDRHLRLYIPEMLVRDYPRQLADRLQGVLALWGAEIIAAPAGNPPETAWFVCRDGLVERLTDGHRVPYRVEEPASCACSSFMVFSREAPGETR